MVSLYRTLSFRYLRQRWLRAALVVASIALGVVTLVATRALSQSMVKAGRAAANPLAGTFDLQISNSEFGVRRELVDELRAAAIPGVRGIEPLVLGRVALPDLDNRSALVLGVPFDASKTADNPWGVEVQITNPLAFAPGRKTVFVGSELAQALAGGIGRLRVRASGKDHALAGAGTVEAHGPAASLGGNVLVMSVTDAGAILGQPGLVTRIDVVLEAGADRDRVCRKMEEVIGARAAVRTPEANDEAIRDIMGGLEIAFSLGGVEALVIGLFLVYNALAVSVAERSHDIGIMRSLGATRGQIAALFAGEAGLLGLVGSLIGIPAGAGVAHLALGPIEQVLSDIFVPLEARQVELTPTTLVVAVLAGILTALLASLVPAIQAAMQEPAEIVRRIPRRAGWIYRGLQVSGSGLLVAAGLSCMALRDLLPLRVGSFAGIALVLLGALAATPLWAALAARLLQPLARLLMGIEGRLAADNLARSPGRTGLVIAAVAAVVALILETSGLILSSEDAIFSWINESIAADLFVTANGPITSGGQNLPMEEHLGQQIRALPDVETAVPVRFQHIDYHDKMIFLIAVDSTRFKDIDPRRIPGPRRALYQRLAEPGTAIVSENFAALQGVSAGNYITLQSPRGPLELRVLGTIVDYSWNRGTIILYRPYYQEHFQDDLVDVFDVYLRPESDIESIRETVLRRWGAENALVMLTRQELCQNVSNVIRRFYGLLYAQEAVVGMVAIIGVVVALLISVLQRRRELGIIRAVGASQSQVLYSVLAEAALMSLIGSVIGLIVGLPLEWYAIRVIILEESGFIFPVPIPFATAALLVCLALVLATLAGLVPALHAVRLRIPDAIAYE